MSGNNLHIMTRDERERALADVHVGIISIAEPGRGPLAVPIWYVYEPGGELWILTPRDSRKGRLLQEVERISLCVQSETPPYWYISLEGAIMAIATATLEDHLRPLSRRYLGTVEGDAFADGLAEALADGSRIHVRMRPERWFAVDYSKGRDEA